MQPNSRAHKRERNSGWKQDEAFYALNKQVLKQLEACLRKNFNDPRFLHLPILIKLRQLSFVISSNLLSRCMLDFLGFPGGSRLQCRRPGFSSWIGKIPWKRAWQPTPVFLPGEFHGERNLAGYNPWGIHGVAKSRT